MWDRCFQLEKLLQHGGNPWLTDDDNKNGFDMAADNNCYEAYQLLNNYLAENKFNFKPEEEEEEPKRIKFSTPDVYCTPKYFSNYKYPDLNNSLNLTYLTAIESKYNSPAIFSTPRYLENSQTENLNESHNCTFMSARENFPLIFSSDDETENLSSDTSAFINKLSLNKNDQNQETSKNEVSSTEQDKCANKVSTIVLEDSENKTNTIVLEDNTKCEINASSKNNLNKAYIFSSSSDASETTTSDLNDSDDSDYCTIIECDDSDDIILIETRNNQSSLHSSNSSVCSVPNDWKSFHKIINSCSSLSHCLSHSKKSLTVPNDLQDYSNSKIFEELKKLGDNPGPVLDHTRHVYLHRLMRLISGCAVSCDLPKPSRN